MQKQIGLICGDISKKVLKVLRCNLINDQLPSTKTPLRVPPAR